MRARKAAGYTQEGFAEAMSVDRSTVARWELGRSEPLPYLRPKLVRLLRLGPGELDDFLVEGSRSTVATATGVLDQSRDDSAAHEWLRAMANASTLAELDLHVTVDIGDDGWAEVTYRRELLNLTDHPVARMSGELWFEHTDRRLSIKPISNDDRRIAIQRDHDTSTFAKFSCLISPPIEPGGSTVVGYVASGAQFVSDHYWRQSAARPTRRLTIQLRHRGAGDLVGCSAVEDLPDGTQQMINEALRWEDNAGVVEVTLTREGLAPNQAVTLRWDVTHEPSR
jgi:transcriptional regulator with XRE-family HTH domain